MKITTVKSAGTILLILLFINSFSQNITYKNLVFEGAGIRGIAYAGAIQELERKGIVRSIERCGGTSAGAIIALCISIGYTGEEIEEMIYNLNFRKFNDGRFIFVGGINRFFKKYGWYRGEKMSEWLGKIIYDKTSNQNTTFGQLHGMGYKDLYITGTCLNKQKLIVFSHENYPDMKIRDAVRISMSIPLYFQAVFIDSTGKIINNPENTDNLDLMLDGGICANFPIHIFDDKKYYYSENDMNYNPHTLGIRIDTEDQIEHDMQKKGLTPYKINDFNDYLGAFYTIIIENLNRHSLGPADWKRTISVSSVGINPKIKRLSKDEKDKLIVSGRKGVINYFFFMSN